MKLYEKLNSDDYYLTELSKVCKSGIIPEKYKDGTRGYFGDDTCRFSVLDTSKYVIQSASEKKESFWDVRYPKLQEEEIKVFIIDNDCKLFIENIEPEYDLPTNLPFPDFCVTNFNVIDIPSIDYIQINKLGSEDKEDYYTVQCFLKIQKFRTAQIGFGVKITENNRLELMELEDKNLEIIIKEPINIVMNYLQNLLNFLDSREAIIHEHTVQRRYYTDKNGIIPVYPPKYSTVTLSPKLHKYMQILKEPQLDKISRYSSWWVRGHWRQLKSLFFRNKRGQKTWVIPHISGYGPMKDTVYEVKGDI